MTHYERLEVGNRATQDEIKQAYRVQVKRWHPDVNKDPRAETIMKAVNAAHAILMDPEKRRQYDLLLASQTTPRAPRGRAHTPPGGAKRPSSGDRRQAQTSEFSREFFEKHNFTQQQKKWAEQVMGSFDTTDRSACGFCGGRRRIEDYRGVSVICPMCRGTGTPSSERLTHLEERVKEMSFDWLQSVYNGFSIDIRNALSEMRSAPSTEAWRRFQESSKAIDIIMTELEKRGIL